MSARLKPKRVDLLFAVQEDDLNITYKGSRVSRFISPVYSNCLLEGYSSVFYLWNRSSTKFDKNAIHAFQFPSLILLKYIPFFCGIFFRFIVRPRVVVSISVPKHFKHACDMFGIPTVEPLHGFGVSYDDYIWGVDQKIHTGSHLAVFDSLSFTTLSSNLHKNYDLVRCVHPFIHFRQSFPDHNLKLILDIFEQKPIILVTLSHGYEGTRPFLDGVLDNGYMHDSLIKVIQTHRHYNWIIKPHPVMLASSSSSKQVYDFLDSNFGGYDNVSYKSSSRFDVIELISLSSLHITMNSSAIVEASLLSVPSIGLCPTFQDSGWSMNLFKEQRDSSMLYITNLDYEDISSLISRLFSTIIVNSPQKASFIETENLYPSLSDYVISLLK